MYYSLGKLFKIRKTERITGLIFKIKVLRLETVSETLFPTLSRTSLEITLHYQGLRSDVEMQKPGIQSI